jgi:geranylgeranyl pyrophosphate synthase
MKTEWIAQVSPQTRRYHAAIQCRLNVVARMESFPEVFNRASAGLIGLRGKLLRPVLTLCAAEITGKRYSARSLDAAVALELLHVSSLILDDIIDEAPLRRGRATLHTRYGNDVAIVTAGMLLLRGLKQVGEDQRLRSVGMDAMGQLLLGQGLETRGKIGSLANYLEMINLKTAALFSAAMEIGAVTNRLGPQWAERLRAYGRHLGLAFQIQDDILDIIGQTRRVGKRVNGTVCMERPTVVTVMLGMRANGNGNGRPATLRNVRRQAERLGVLRSAVALANRYVDEANEMALSWPKTPARQCLLRLTSAMMIRDR